METIQYERDVLSRERESIRLRYLVQGKPMALTCSVLHADGHPSDSVAAFSHPSPCFTRLFCFRRGVARFQSAQESRALVPGIVYLIPSDLPFDIVYEKTHLYYFHLHITDFTLLSVFRHSKEVLELDDSYLFEHILSSYEAGNTQELLSIISLSLSRFMAQVRDELPISRVLTATQRELIERIDQLQPACINVNELADEFGGSRSTLSRNFSNSFGYSLKEYINKVTMQKARERLRYTGDTVETIAVELGFNHATYFYRFFRKQGGMTPLEYRGL